MSDETGASDRVADCWCDGARRARQPRRTPEPGKPLPSVSVVIPARDAEATLVELLESVLAQNYRPGFEVIVADGSERNATAELVRRRFPGVRLLGNPDRSIPSGLNRALAVARHPVVARCDTRTILPPGYLSRAVRTLCRTGADNVGGRIHPVGATGFERAVGLATGTPLAAGDARYRIGGSEGPVDTVYPGVFLRESVVAAGGWDETLLGNEDYELNWRLRRNGGTVWFDPGLAVRYRPHGSLVALARRYFDYGRWKRVVLARHPRSWRVRQLLPPLLLLGLTASVALAGAGTAVLALATPPAAAGTALLYAAAACPLGYALFLVVASTVIGLRRPCAEALLVPLVTATIHLAWAAGFLVGIAPRVAER